MAHTYTPGLRVTPRAVIRKTRQLPIRGEVLARMGARVDSEDVVARTLLPGKVQSVNIVNQLSIPPAEIKAYMLKQEGEPVQKDDPLAQNRPLIKFLRTVVRSPITGSVETISEVTGQVLLREPPRALDLRAYIDGTVVEVLEGRGVVIETAAAFAQGIFGIGGETTGALILAVDRPDQPLTPDRLGGEHAGRIAVGGAFVHPATYTKARELGVKGIIAGGVSDGDLRQLLGYDLGVAITGTEQVGFTLVVTEGFGRIAMAKRTFELLRANVGRKACISGATQIRAGVVRPEIIIPLELSPAEVPEESAAAGGALQIGTAIRIIRTPYFGRLGRVTALPAELARMASGTLVRVLEAELQTSNGKAEVVRVPRANVERIED